MPVHDSGPPDRQHPRAHQGAPHVEPRMPNTAIGEPRMANADGERHTPSAHPAILHRTRAADHLRAAAHQLDQAVECHEQRAHQTAWEHAKEANGHIGEAKAHVREADRLHEEYEWSH